MRYLKQYNSTFESKSEFTKDDLNQHLNDIFAELIDDRSVELSSDEGDSNIYVCINFDLEDDFNISNLINIKKKNINILEEVDVCNKRLSDVCSYVNIRTMELELEYIVIEYNVESQKEKDFYVIRGDNKILIDVNKLKSILDLKDVDISISTSGINDFLDFNFKRQQNYDQYINNTDQSLVINPHHMKQYQKVCDKLRKLKIENQELLTGSFTLSNGGNRTTEQTWNVSFQLNSNYKFETL